MGGGALSGGTYKPHFPIIAFVVNYVITFVGIQPRN